MKVKDLIAALQGEDAEAVITVFTNDFKQEFDVQRILPDEEPSRVILLIGR